MKLKDLKQSEELLELRPVNAVTVSRYRQAMRQGAEFPPLKVDTVHGIVVGGNHRMAAMLAEFGENHDVKVTKVKLETWADVLEEFAVDNAKHGMPLEGFSRRRTALALIEAGKPPEEVARLFDVSQGRLEQWGATTVRVIGKRGKQTAKPVKHGVPQDATPVKEAEYQKHVRADKGVTVRHMAEQITSYAERGWLQLEDDKEKASLTRLRDALIAALK